MPSASIGIGIAEKDETASTISATSGYFASVQQISGNGFITPVEVDSWTAMRFPKLDLDKDGFVSKGEARQIQNAIKKG